MNSEQPNLPINPEKEWAKEESYLHDTVDPQDKEVAGVSFKLHSTFL